MDILTRNKMERLSRNLLNTMQDAMRSLRQPWLSHQTYRVAYMISIILCVSS